MIDLRNGGQAFIKVMWVVKKTVHSLIDSVGWQTARESVRAAKSENWREIVDTMRVWEAFAGVHLAQKEGESLNKETSKSERYALAASLYKQADSFIFLEELEDHYDGDLQRLEGDLESCYISGKIPDPVMQQKLNSYFINSAQKSAQKAFERSYLRSTEIVQDPDDPLKLTLRPVNLAAGSHLTVGPNITVGTAEGALAPTALNLPRP